MNKNRFRLKAFLIVMLVAMLTISVAGAAPKDGPSVEVSVGQSEFGANEDVLVNVTFSNASGHSVRILKWFTPVDGLEEPVLKVMRNGEALKFNGPHFKRPAATGNDYISLKSGESLSYTVDLGAYYDLSETGEYDVSYSASSFSLFNEKGNALKYRDVLTSSSVSFKADGRAAKPGGTPAPTPPPGGNGFKACTIDQQTLIASARNTAKVYASNAENYLLAGTQGLRYTTWFGVFNTTRYNTVKTNFTAISNAWDNAGVNFDCGCKQNYYAYVYPNQPYNIYLCKAFWTAPASGTDSKAGTLIHEMSHFDIVAGTDDVVYGQTGAKNLAISDPNAAVTNADSHEYFAENTPSQP